MLNRVMVFVGWVLSAFSFVIALAGLATPGAGKLMSLALIGWCLIFLPPLWIRTIKHGLPVNIVVRVVAFFTLPVIFMAIATANGYHSPPVADRSTVLPQKKPDKEPATASKQPTERVASEAIKAPSQCEKDVKAAGEVDSMHDTHSDIYPAFESCGSINEFVAAATKYPKGVHGNNPKVYLANICSSSETLDRGICKEVPNYPGVKTEHFLELKEYSDLPTPVSDKTTMQGLFDAARANDEDRYLSIARAKSRQLSIFLVKGEPVDVLDRDGDLVQVRLHAIDINGDDLEGKVLWTYAKALKTSYQYAK